MLLPRTDGWYRSLFAPAGDRLCGETIPEYARMNEAGVARIRRVAPDARIIYLLRNPIDRAWSQAAMHFDKTRDADLAGVSDEDLFDFFEDGSVRRNGEYMRTLDLWERHFSPDRIFIGFFDRLRDDPAGLFADVCRFLGAKTSPDSLPAGLEAPRNARSYRGASSAPHTSRHLIFLAQPPKSLSEKSGVVALRAPRSGSTFICRSGVARATSTPRRRTRRRGSQRGTVAPATSTFCRKGSPLRQHADVGVPVGLPQLLLAQVVDDHDMPLQPVAADGPREPRPVLLVRCRAHKQDLEVRHARFGAQPRAGVRYIVLSFPLGDRAGRDDQSGSWAYCRVPGAENTHRPCPGAVEEVGVDTVAELDGIDDPARVGAPGELATLDGGPRRRSKPVPQVRVGGQLGQCPRQVVNSSGPEQPGAFAVGQQGFDVGLTGRSDRESGGHVLDQLEGSLPRAHTTAGRPVATSRGTAAAAGQA
ncbi:MAG: sulfotransferase domain-containing protein [Acidobacteriota bacterium]